MTHSCLLNWLTHWSLVFNFRSLVKSLVRVISDLITDWLFIWQSFIAYFLQLIWLLYEFSYDCFFLSQNELFNNRISDPVGPFAPLPTIDEIILVKNNEVGLRESPNQENGQHSNVLMTIAEEESLFNNTEVLAGEEMVLIHL